MSERIDQFCEGLRAKLTNIDHSMQILKAKMDNKAKSSEQEVRAHLDAVTKRIEADRVKVTAAQNDLKKWVEERKAATNEKIAEWKAKSEKARLQSRANLAEKYALGAAVVALEAVSQAQQASLEAWLARKDAETAKTSQAA